MIMPECAWICRTSKRRQFDQAEGRGQQQQGVSSGVKSPRSL